MTSPVERMINREVQAATTRLVLVLGELPDEVRNEIRKLQADGANQEAYDLAESTPEAATDIGAQMAVGLACLGLQRDEEALVRFQNAGRLVELRRAAVHLNCACALNRLARHAEAEFEARKALDIDPYWYGAWINLMSARRQTVETLPELVAELNARWPDWPNSAAFRSTLAEDVTLSPLRKHPLFHSTFLSG